MSDRPLERWHRMILHADMDAFYAAIEQLDDASLRGRPLLVGPKSARGVVLTASYEARPYGVGSAMPMARARKLCPEALVVPPRFERYREVSSAVMAIFRDFSPDVEPISLDEAFLDMTGSERLFGTPEAIGKRLKAAVREATGGLTVSVGISGTKYVAKVASGWRKPDALTIVPPPAAREWLAPLPVEQLWGAGPKTAARLRACGFATLGDVASCDEERLTRELGSVGRRFAALARGEDARPVESAWIARSLSSERTLEQDVAERAAIELHLRSAADDVARRLRRRGLRARGVRVKLKRSDFRILTRQSVLPEPSDVAAALFAAVRALLDGLDRNGPFRLVGLAAYDLIEAGAKEQGILALGADAKARRLEVVLDRVAERFGSGFVQRAAALEAEPQLVAGSNLDFLDGDAEDR